jgi:hypothetical protein
MKDQFSFLHIAALVSFVVFVLSFFTAFYATLLVIARTGPNRAEERELSWGERAGRANSRLGRFFIADEFRSLRRLYFGASMATIGSFGLCFHAVASRADLMNAARVYHPAACGQSGPTQDEMRALYGHS